MKENQLSHQCVVSSFWIRWCCESWSSYGGQCDLGQRHQYQQATGWMTEESFRSREQHKTNPLQVSSPALWPTRPPIQWVLQALATAIKWLRCAAYCSPTVTARVKNGWSYKSTYVVYTDTLPFPFTVVSMKITAMQDVVPCISYRCTNISEEPHDSIVMNTLQDHCMNWNSGPHGPEKDNFLSKFPVLCS